MKTKKEIFETIERFERNILHDCHSLPIKLNRSQSFASLVGTQQLGIQNMIGKYLLENRTLLNTQIPYPLVEKELEEAWIILAKRLCVKFKLAAQISKEDFSEYKKMFIQFYVVAQKEYDVIEEKINKNPSINTITELKQLRLLAKRLFEQDKVRWCNEKIKTLQS